MRDVLGRGNIQTIVEVNGMQERDFLDSPLTGIELTKEPAYVTVTEELAGRADLNSYKV
jgi:hypothetical protein